MIRILFALVLAVVTVAAPAQTVNFPGGWVRGTPLLVVEWQGRPALLALNLVPGLYGGPSPFLDFNRPTPPPFTFHLAAGYFEDRRPCAPGSPVHVTVEDIWHLRTLGTIGQDGTLLWIASTSSPRVLMPHYPYLATAILGQHFYASYCISACFGKCYGDRFDGPRLAALVLTIN